MLDIILELNGYKNNFTGGIKIYKDNIDKYIYKYLPKDRYTIKEVYGKKELTIYKQSIPICRAEIEKITLEDLIFWYKINNNGGKTRITLTSKTSIKNNQIIKTQMLKYLPQKTISAQINTIILQHHSFNYLKTLAQKDKNYIPPSNIIYKGKQKLEDI